MKKFFRKVGKRLTEPSTWSALGALLMVFGIKVDPGMMQDLATGAGAIAAAGGMVLGEKGPDD